MKEFQGWLSGSFHYAKEGIIKTDKQLSAFIQEKQEQLAIIEKDFEVLQKLVAKKKWDETKPATIAMIADLGKVNGIK